MARSIEQIDQQIDEVRRRLVTRLRFNPGMSARQWQAAWDRCPDLRMQETALFLERYDAQQARNAKAEKEFKCQQRAERREVKRRDETICYACGQNLLQIAA